MDGLNRVEVLRCCDSREIRAKCARWQDVRRWLAIPCSCYILDEERRVFFSRVILLWMHCAQEFRSELFEQTFVVESKSICHGRKSDPADGKRVRINRYYRRANYSNPAGPPHSVAVWITRHYTKGNRRRKNLKMMIIHNQRTVKNSRLLKWNVLVPPTEWTCVKWNLLSRSCCQVKTGVISNHRNHLTERFTAGEKSQPRERQ